MSRRRRRSRPPRAESRAPPPARATPQERPATSSRPLLRVWCTPRPSARHAPRPNLTCRAGSTMRTCVRLPNATILHADLDAFFASVEQRDDPRLRGRPVIVGGGVVLAASYEAKAYGIATAMGGRQARRLCPHAIVVPPRMSVYSEASKAVFAVFADT